MRIDLRVKHDTDFMLKSALIYRNTTKPYSYNYIRFSIFTYYKHTCWAALLTEKRKFIFYENNIVQ